MRKPAILFLGTHGQYNIGDELLLETFLQRLGSGRRYVVNSYDPSYTDMQLRQRFEVRTFHTTESRFTFLRQLLKSDVVFFGGGSILKELYESIGRNRYATLAMVLAVVTFAKQIARKPVIMSNIGVGPITSLTGRWFATAILRQVDVVSVRDQASFELCGRLPLGSTNVIQVPDAAFMEHPTTLLGSEDADVITPRFVAAGVNTPMRVALNLNFDIANPENWQTFLDNLEDGLRRLHTVAPIELHLLPMQSKGKPNHDAEMLEQFAERLPDITSVPHTTNDGTDVARILADCDVLVGERLHSIILATILGIPSMPLMYDVKVRGLVHALGLERFAFDPNAPFDPVEFASTLDTLIRDRDEVHTHLVARTRLFRKELDAYFAEVEDWMSEIGASVAPAASATETLEPLPTSALHEVG